MSSLLRHHSDDRLLPSLLTSPSRRRVEFANRSDQATLGRQYNSHPVIYERLAQVLGLQHEQVFNYGSGNHFLNPQHVSNFNDLSTNFNSLTISNRNANLGRPVTAPALRSLGREVTEPPPHIPEGNTSVADVRSTRNHMGFTRRTGRIGRNEQRLRNESRELIEHLSNENALPEDDAFRMEVLDQRLNNTTIPTMSDLHYLQTYDMRNNFYLNLVTWSCVNNKIAVAIKEKAYWWDGLKYVAPINLKGNLKSISVISCSSNDILAVGFQDGLQGSLSLILPNRRSLFFSHSCAFQCLAWFPNTLYLIAGDMLGNVIIFEYSEASIMVRSKWKGFDQQVCGTYEFTNLKGSPFELFQNHSDLFT